MLSIKQSLRIDYEAEIKKLCDFIETQVFSNFRRKGTVVGLSGGIDSALVSTLCVNALGKEKVLGLILPEKVLGLILPEKESNPSSKELGIACAEELGIPYEIVDITPQLEAFNLYSARDEIIKGIFPEFNSSYKFKVSLPQDLLERDRFNYRIITIQSPNGEKKEKRLSINEWFQISAAQNIKQRTRMINLYYHAEKRNYIVAGTTNKSELLMGFYVKYGDGGVDMEPISHLYKTQVYRLGEYLNVNKETLKRPPSPDTYSLTVSDQEFFFCIPYDILDILLYGWENKIPEEQISSEVNLTKEQINRAFRDFELKKNASWHLRELPVSL